VILKVRGRFVVTLTLFGMKKQGDILKRFGERVRELRFAATGGKGRPA
jgi:hypothetical protein